MAALITHDFDLIQDLLESYPGEIREENVWRFKIENPIRAVSYAFINLDRKTLETFLGRRFYGSYELFNDFEEASFSQ